MMTEHDECLSDASRIGDLERRIRDLERDRKSSFKTGILVLGAAVVGLVTYIWSIQVG